MPVPATIGQERFNLTDMQIGDYIACEYTASSGAVGTFANLGSATKEEIPVTGSATPDGKFYFIKVDKGLLVADRVVQHSISWKALNAGKVIEGKVHTFGDLTCLIRSLSGGVAYANVNGNKSTTDLGYGAFPTNNEWDKYIVNSDLDGKIIPGDDNVWHWSGIATITKDTPIEGFSGTGISNQRIYRGNSSYNRIINHYFDIVTNSYGFRPVLEYREGGSNLW